MERALSGTQGRTGAPQEKSSSHHRLGSDIVFATVQLIAGEGEVLDWRMDGRPMDVEALTPMQVATLVNIARETEHQEEV